MNQSASTTEIAPTGGGIHTRKWKIAAVIERPIPFYVPHYRLLAQARDIDLQVIYLNDDGLKPFDYHKVRIAYSDEILQGYHSIVLGRGNPRGRVERAIDFLLPELWRVLRSGHYDAVWFHGYNLIGHWIGFFACVAGGLPILLRGESELMFERAWLRRSLKRLAFGWLFPRVTGFLYIGTLNREFYRYYGVADSKLFSMPYGIDNTWFEGRDADERQRWRDDVRRHLGIAASTIVFINHSKHRPPKRPADVVRAFARLDADADAVLVLVGDGDQGAEIDAACLRLRDEQRVFRLGFQSYEELRRLLAAADVLAFASEENWGMAVNEGLAAGLAILCSDRVAGAVDMVEEGTNGFIFRSRDEADLAGKMRRMIEHPALVKAMGRASRAKAADFSFDAMNSGLRAALSSMGSGPSIKSAGGIV